MKVDRIVRNAEDIENALNLVDSEVLAKYLRIDMSICASARKIWQKMQHRRLKRG